MGLKLRRNNKGEWVSPWKTPVEIWKGGDFQLSVWISAVSFEYV